MKYDEVMERIQKEMNQLNGYEEINFTRVSIYRNKKPISIKFYIKIEQRDVKE